MPPESAPLELEKLHSELLSLRVRLSTAEDRLVCGQKWEVLGKLVPKVAHEFNNILTIINGCALHLERETAADTGSACTNTLAIVSRAVSRGARIIQQLTNYSRPGLGECADIDLSSLVLESVGLLEVALGSQVEVRVDLASGLRPVHGDAHQIVQCLMNLGINSGHAMPTGGILTVRTAPSGENVMLEVEDTGTGIPPQIVDRVFEPYFSTKEKGQGTGLGLSVVKEIICRHGGEIQFESVGGRGTVFTILLPAAGIRNYCKELAR